MGSPSTANQTATAINAGIKNLSGTLVNVAEGLIIAEVPFLGYPVIKQIWEAIFNWIASYFVRAAQTGATFAVIDYQVDHEKSRISEALAALIAAEKTGDKDAIKKAIADYQAAQSALIHADGSAPIN